MSWQLPLGFLTAVMPNGGLEFFINFDRKGPGLHDHGMMSKAKYPAFELSSIRKFILDDNVAFTVLEDFLTYVPLLLTYRCGCPVGKFHFDLLRRARCEDAEAFLEIGLQ